MKSLRQRFKLPLRWRFVLQPLLGLALISGLTTGFVFESRRQSGLAEHYVQEDLTKLSRLASLFVQLSLEHMDLSMMHDDESIGPDSAALYHQEKAALEKIRTTTAELTVALRDKGDESDYDQSATNVTKQQLIDQIARYQQLANHAVELTVSHPDMAGHSLNTVNHLFIGMNQLFNQLFAQQLQASQQEADENTELAHSRITLFGGGGFVASSILLLFMLMLARRLSRDLEQQFRSLTELGQQADAAISTDTDSGEIDRIAWAIAAFRTALHKIMDDECRLTELNQELQRARGELEERVSQRTRELSVANAELHGEVERRRQIEQHLAIYGAVIRSMGESVTIADHNGRIIDANPAYEQATGYPREEVIGTLLTQRAQEYMPRDELDQLWRSVHAHGSWHGEMLERRKNGEVFPAWALINVVRSNDDEPHHFVSVSRDITLLKRNEQQLQRLALYDTLSGLANRALFADRLQIALAAAKRQQTQLALLYVDLDKFKYVNDTLGHPVGDKLLVEIAGRLIQTVRSSDTVARMGGDEFTVLLSEWISADEVFEVAERIITEVCKAVRIEDMTVFVGASIGISFYPRDGEDGDTLVKYADLALYEAKQAGRGQYRAFNVEMLSRVRERLSLNVRIDDALANNEFELFYQPIIDVGSGVTTAVEALIRWRQADGEFVFPATFIPHAEEAGLIKRIDLWVLERACRDAMAWQRDFGLTLHVSVNLSSVSVQQSALPGQIDHLLQQTGLPAHLLRIEVTETGVIANPLVAGSVLREISALGVAISMDDFGTGYSSLTHLTQFPLDHIKLDQSFVQRIGKDTSSEAIICALLELAKTLKIRVVAEGIESPEQLLFLQQRGCDYLQGYHFSRPLPRDELLAWLGTASTAGTACAHEAG